MTLRIDHVSGAAAIAIGIAVFALSGDLPFGRLSMPGAGMMPKLLCGALIVFGIAQICRAGDREPLSTVDWSDLRHAGFVLAVTALVIGFYSQLGFILAMTALLAALVFRERGNIVYALLYGAGVSVSTYALFVYVLKSPLERGLIWF